MPATEKDLKLSRKMQKISRKLDELLTKEMGERMGFGVVVFPFSPEGASPGPVEFQYTSNANRMHMHEAMRSMVKKWDDGHVDIPPHDKN
jgi:hypothetical protein